MPATLDSQTGFYTTPQPEPPSFTPEEAWDVAHSQEFAALSPEERQSAADHMLSTAFTSVNDGQWSQEKQQQWHEFATTIQQKAMPDWTEKATKIGQQAFGGLVQMVAGLPGQALDAAMAGVDALNAVEDPQSGGLAKAYGRSMIGQGAQLMAIPYNQWAPRAQAFDAFQQQLEGGQLPLQDAEALKTWAGEWTKQFPDLGTTAGQEALQRYLTTRNPNALHELGSMIKRSDLSRWGQQQVQQAIDSPEVRDLPTYLQEQFAAASDPLNVAMMAAPMLRAGKAAQATTAAARVGQVAKSAGEGAAIGALMHQREDPNAGLSDTAEAAATMAVMTGGMASVGALRPSPREAPGSGSPPPPASEPTAPRPAGWDGGMVEVSIDPALLRDGMEGATDGDFAALDQQFTKPQNEVTRSEVPMPTDVQSGLADVGSVEGDVLQVGRGVRSPQVQPRFAEAPPLEGVPVETDFAPVPVLPVDQFVDANKMVDANASERAVVPQLDRPAPAVAGDSGRTVAEVSPEEAWQNSPEFEQAAEAAMRGDVEAADRIEAAFMARAKANEPVVVEADALFAKRTTDPFVRAREWADRTIKDKQGQLRTGFDPELIAAYAIRAVGTGVDFATYVAGVVKEFGEGAREMARDAWVRVHATMRNDPRVASEAKPLKEALGGAPADYSAWRAEDMQARANGISAAYSTPELVRALSSDPGLQRMGVDPSLREFMNAEALRRALADVGRATNDVDRIRAQSVLRQARSIYDVSGTEAGQHLASRALAAKDLRAEAPDLAMTEAIEKEQVSTIDKAIPVEPTTEATGEAAKIAGEAATENLAEKIKRRLTTRDKLLETDSPALARLVNALREKITGLNWRDVFTSRADTQRQWEMETYTRIRQHEMLKDLTHDEAVKLTREFSKAWQRERRDVFQRELEKSLLRAGLKPRPLAKVKAASERLLKLINLGALDASTFRDALAKEFGIKDLSAPEIKQVRELAQKYQSAPDGVARRRLGQQIIERMQDVTRLSKAELLESYWTTAVLSGWRTMMDIGLAVANGIEDVGFGGIVTALRTGNADAALRGVSNVLGNLPRALNEAWHIAVTGDKSIMRNYQRVIDDALSDGGRDFASAARQLREKGGLVGKPAGLFMEGMARVLTALDHINQSSTAAGAKWLAMAEHPELYRKALEVTARDRELARERALNELTGGAEPTTNVERVQVKARVEEIIDEMVPTEIISEAMTIGEDAALIGEPTGLGYFAVKAVRAIVGMPDEAIKALETGPKAKQIGTRELVFALKMASTFGRVLTGTKFVRVVGHQFNRSLSYVPGVGLARFAEGSMKGVKADVLIAKQLVGLTASLAVLNWFRSGGKDGDEKRGIEGNWKNINPNQRSQLYAQGKQPNTIWYRDDKGRVVSFNFQQWGLSGMFAALGAMEDQRRYHGHNKIDGTVLFNGLMGGLFAWQDKAQIQGLQTILGESPYASDNIGENFVKRLNKWASMTVGGLVPRVLKDIDLVASPTLRDSSEWWAQWSGQVPMLRELSTGARVDIFGNDIKLDRGPMSRVWLRGNEGKPYQLLGLLNERDVWLPDPSAAQRVVKTRAGRRPLAREERDRYQRLTGAAYADYIERNGENFVNYIERGGPPEKRADRVMKIRATISKQTKPLRDRAAQAAVR